jgi:polysaccharide export outer membrane protein
MLSACAPDQNLAGLGAQIASEATAPFRDAGLTQDGYPVPVTPVAWGPPVAAPGFADNGDGPYRLDTGDKLRIFVYGQPDLSRMYVVDQERKIAVPLIGNVGARGRTTNELQGVIKSRLGSEYVKNPQVTVDIEQNRPFFILGEVKNAGQYPYVSRMPVKTAVAIAGGYSTVPANAASALHAVLTALFRNWWFLATIC